MNITNYIVIATFTRQFILLLVIIIINSGGIGWAQETCKGQKFSQKHATAVAGSRTATQRIYVCLAVPYCKNVSRYVEAAMRLDKTHPVVKTFDVGYYKDCDLIWPVFDDCYNRFKSETATNSSKIDNISLILAGPWCDEIPRARRAVRRLKFDNKHKVIFLTASLNVAAPRHGVHAGSSASDHFEYPLTVLLYGLEHRYGQLLYYLLSEQFKWKRYVMVNLLSTQKRMENSYCDDMFTYVRLLAARVGHVMTELYTYRIPAKARTLDDEAEYLRQFWRQLTTNNRVIVVCGSIERVVKMIEKMAPVLGARYGVILVKGSFGESDRFVRHLLQQRMTAALEFIKVLSLRPISCATASIKMNSEYDDRKINLDDVEDVAEDDAISRTYFCAISDAVSTLLTSNLSFLTENRTYVYETRRLELLPPHELYTFDRALKTYVLALQIDWKAEKPTIVRPVSRILSPIRWSGQDGTTVINDSPHVCQNRSASFMCPQISFKLVPFYFKLVVAFLVVVSTVVCTIGTLLCVRCRNRYKHLLFFRRLYLRPQDLQYYHQKDNKAVKQKLVRKFHQEQLTPRIPQGCVEVGVYPRFGTYRKATKFVAYDVISNLQSSHLRHATVSQDLNELDRLAKTSRQLVEILGIDDSQVGFYTIVCSFDVGSLLTFLMRRLSIQTDLKYSLVRDLAMALRFINQSFMRCHGDLRSDRCIVDERFVLRVVITRLPSISALEKSYGAAGRRAALAARLSGSLRMGGENPGLIWAAPEVLRDPTLSPTPQSDVYSFGVIAHEITYQMGTFYRRDIHKKHMLKAPQPASPMSMCKRSVMSSSTLRPIAEAPKTPSSSGSFSFVEDPFDLSCALEVVRARKKNRSLQPETPVDAQYSKGGGATCYRMLSIVMKKCWSNEPSQRPKIQQISDELQGYGHKNNIDVVFNVGRRLTKASKAVLNMYDVQKKDSVDHTIRAVKYLVHLMPANVCYEFLAGYAVKKTNMHANLTILFVNLTNFHDVGRQKSYFSMFKVLDQLLTKYDQLLIFYDVMPMHRVGTSLMLCSGILKENAGHASEIAQVAMQIRQLVKDSGGLVCKMGMHSGQVRSGVVGQNIPQFGIFGDAVNTASRMASTANEFEIQLSAAAEKALRSSSNDFLLDAGKEKEVKGLGKMLIYSLKGYLKYKNAENLPLNGRLDMQTAFKRVNTDNETSSLASRLGPSARSPFSGGKVVQQAPMLKKLPSTKGALRSGKSAKSAKSTKRWKLEGFSSKKAKNLINKRTKSTASIRDTTRSSTPRTSRRNARTP